MFKRFENAIFEQYKDVKNYLAKSPSLCNIRIHHLLETHMKYLLTSLIFLLCFSHSFCQRIHVYDTTEKHYRKTDFQKVDSPELWTFELDTSYVASKKDRISAIGKIRFQRTKSMDDGISQEVYGKLWTPYIEFEIFPRKDSLYCAAQSKKTRLISSCKVPETGGDLLKVGDFIFLNTDVCLECIRYDTGTDYCRPLLKKVFEKVNVHKGGSLLDIVKQFPFEKIKRTSR